MDIKVNDQEWADLGRDEQARIEKIVSGYFKGARIVPDKDTARSAPPEAGLLAQTNPFCKAGCDIAQAAATAACASLVNPIAIAACIAAAQAAGDLCRSKC